MKLPGESALDIRQAQYKNMATVPLSSLSDKEIIYFQILNKYIIDSMVSKYTEGDDEQENQEIFTFQIPQPRHRNLDFFLRKIFHHAGLQWHPLENSYTNHKYQLKNGLLNILVKKNVTKDTNILYYTTANEILDLQDMGLTRSQALTSQVVEAMGHYNLHVEERRIHAGIVTNKTHLKKYILARAQKLVRQLQPIERQICNHKDLSSEEYATRLRLYIQDYLKKLEKEHETICALIKLKRSGEIIPPAMIEKLKFWLNLSEPLIEEFLQYDHEFLLDLAVQCKKRMSYTKEFFNSVKNKYSVTNISDSLQSFLIYQLNKIVHDAQSQNDQITSNSDNSMFRGKLREFLMDADKVINNYTFDPLNPITRAHQSDFRLDKDKKPSRKTASFGHNKILYQSSVHAGNSKEDQERVLTGITALEDARKRQAGEEIAAPKMVHSAGWNNFSTHTSGQKGKRFLAWALTNLAHIPLGLLNTVVTAITGQAPVARLMQTSEIFIRDLFQIHDEFNHDYYRFREKLGGNNLYTSTLTGRMLHKVIHEITGLVVRAPIIVAERVAQQLACFVDDFKSGLWGKLYNSLYPPEPPVINRPAAIKPAMSEMQLDVLERWVETAKDLNLISDKNLFNTQLKFAVPTKPLSPYAPHDLLNIVVNATASFINIFKDGVFEKHPVTGFLATLAYLWGGAAVLTPTVLKVILAKSGFTNGQINLILSICQNIGKPLAKDGYSQALASGFTLAKVMGLSMNTAAEGFDSALAEVITEISKNPVLYVVGICVSYGFGHLVVDVADIPFITAFCQDDIGTVPALGKIMIGAKLGLISLEAALPEDEAHPSILADFIGDIAKNTMIAARIALTPLSLSAQPFTDVYHQALKGGAIVVHAINRASTVIAQCAMQFLKTFLEVSVTLFTNIIKLGNFLISPLIEKKDHGLPIVGDTLHLKNDLVQAGYDISFFIRKNCSRRPEQIYSRAVKQLDHHAEPEIKDYPGIIAKLKRTEVNKPGPALQPFKFTLSPFTPFPPQKENSATPPTEKRGAPAKQAFTKDLPKWLTEREEISSQNTVACY